MSVFEKLRRFKSYSCGAVIVAAGSGTRMGGVDKLMADLGGKPVLAHTLLAFQQARSIDEIVLVVREDQMEEIRLMTLRLGLSKLKTMVPGGATRMESVQNGLKALSGKCKYVAVQDGARPLVTVDLIQRVMEKAGKYQAVAPGIPVKDTIKQVDDSGLVVATPDRDTLRAVQTPQVFQKELLKAAWKKAKKEKQVYTDDCAAMEAMGVPVYLVEGDEENLKITTPQDLTLAAAILAGRDPV